MMQTIDIQTYISCESSLEKSQIIEILCEQEQGKSAADIFCNHGTSQFIFYG
jgi:hypothetical protein